MISARTMGQDGATLRIQGWDGSMLGARPLGGADPLGFAAGDANLYRYVGNDPTNHTDTTGQADDTTHTIAHYVATGNLEGLQALVGLESGGLTAAQQAALNAGIKAVQAARAAAAAAAAAALAAAQQRLQQIYQQFPATAYKCVEAAKATANVFTNLGQKPIFIKITSPGTGPFFPTPDGQSSFSRNGVHYACQVGGRVYDALTGSAGMTMIEYLQYLNKLGLNPAVSPVAMPK